MSSESVQGIRDLATRVAIEATWTQWSALTTSAVRAGTRKPKSIIDPEALILMSLALRQEERRLIDLIAGLAKNGSALLSVQRMRSLSSSYPQAVRQGVREFASLAMASGDKRWGRLSAGTDASNLRGREKDLGPLRLLDGPALTLRLRAGFGVGAKADILSFLLGLHHAGASLRVIGLATGYAPRTLRTATAEMESAGLINQVDSSPPAFAVPLRPWALVLESHRVDEKRSASEPVPPWRYWSVIFAFLAEVIHWADEAERGAWSPYLASSRARDLVEGHRASLSRTRVVLPNARGVAGAEYLEEFRALLQNVATWTEES